MSIKNRILTLMTAMFFVGMAATDIYISSLPIMQDEFDVSPSVINLTLTSYNVGIACFLLLAPIASEYFSRRRLVLGASLIFTVASFTIWQVDSIWTMIALRAVQSIGAALLIIVSRDILKDIMNEREQIRANAIILLGIVLSPAIAPIIGAYLSELFGWRSCFAFIGMLGVLMTFAAYFALPETKAADKLSSSVNAKEYFTRYINVLGNPFFLALTIMQASVNGAFFAFLGVSSYLYMDDFDFDQTEYAYIYASMAIAYLLGNKMLLRFNRSNGSYDKILKAGITSALLGSILIAIGDLFGYLTPAIVLITLGSLITRYSGALINPSTQVLTLNAFKANGSIALGLSMSVTFFTTGFAMWAVTLWKHEPELGYSVISVVFGIIGLLAYLKVKRKLHERKI